MIKWFRIWSAFAGINFILAELATAPKGKPWIVLLPYLIVGGLLITGAVVRCCSRKALLLAWGFSVGYSFVAMVDLLTVIESPDFVVVLSAIAFLGSLISLLAFWRLTTFEIVNEGKSNWFRKTMILVAVSIGSVVLFLLLFTSWIDHRNVIIKLVYLPLAVLIPIASTKREVGYPFVLSAWSVATGFFYAELTGFLVFFETARWAVSMSLIVCVLLVIGTSLALISPETAKRPSGSST